MKKIFKYVIPVTDHHILHLPEGAKILSVANQHDNIVMYALVDPEKTAKRLDIRVCGTGHALDNRIEQMTFIGTVSLHGGRLMFHVFYEWNP